MDETVWAELYKISWFKETAKKVGELMQYISEIKAFYDLVELNQLSTGQIALWHGLMHINNKCLWQEWFTVPNLRLQLLTGLSRQGIAKNRNILKQFGVLDFKTNGTKATAYMLKSSQAGCQASSQVVVKLVDKELSSQLHINKTETKTKTKTKDIPPVCPPKHKHGEFCHVLLTEEEQARYIKDFGQAKFKKAVKILDEYIETSGKKYKNHNLVLRGWVLDRLRQDGKQASNQGSSFFADLQEIMAEDEVF